MNFGPRKCQRCVFLLHTGGKAGRCSYLRAEQSSLLPCPQRIVLKPRKTPKRRKA